MARKGYIRCPRCNYTNDPQVMTNEAKMYWNELVPDLQKLIQNLFKIVNKHVYGNKLTALEKSKFLYTIGGTKDKIDVIRGIKEYMHKEMYLKALPLNYLSAMIRNFSERKEITLKAERRMRGYDPPE